MARKLKVLDLFSGIGGFSLGLERTGGFETVAFCEIEDFPRRVLAKHWPEVPCHPDVRKLRGKDIGTVDVICGGYPCQPFSTAGKRRGAEDDRHLWPEFMRLVAELRPSWVIGENVAGHISMGLDNVLSDLEGAGYACRPFAIPAVAVDAKHRRMRVWTVAHRNSNGTNNGRERETGHYLHRNSAKAKQGRDKFQSRFERYRQDVADAYQAGLQEWPRENSGRQRTNDRTIVERGSQWIPEPDVGRVAHGVPNRVDRLKALGNAVVPQIPELIGRAILAAEAA